MAVKIGSIMLYDQTCSRHETGWVEYWQPDCCLIPSLSWLDFILWEFSRILKKWVLTDRERADPYKGPTLYPDLFLKSLETK